MKLKLLAIKESTETRICSCSDVCKLMEEESRADRECFWVLHLNVQRCLIEKELVFIGTLNSVPASARETFKKAIINGAHSIICVHNHPSGNSYPSEQDIQLFKNLKLIGDLLGIEVLDSVILGRDCYYSFYHATCSHEEEQPEQIEPQVELATICELCGEFIEREIAINDGEIYCQDCWEITFGCVDDC